MKLKTLGVFAGAALALSEAYPVDSGGATYSILGGPNRAVAGTSSDGQGALAFAIPKGVF